jgi:hypothetical protein
MEKMGMHGWAMPMGVINPQAINPRVCVAALLDKYSVNTLIIETSANTLRTGTAACRHHLKP